MARSGNETRRQILDAAERLFAERGVEAVALSEINVAAGQRNNAAVHYHFGSKDALLDAVLERRSDEIEAARRIRLDDLDSGDAASLRQVVEALVVPLADLLDYPGGTNWLQVQARLLTDPVRSPLQRRPWRSSEDRIAELVEYTDDDTRTHWTDSRNSLVNTLVFHGLADYARQQSGERELDRSLFVTELVDAVVAIVAAPVRQETR